ncbi:MAG: hypothetical protein ACKORA_08615, partial [Solirubrobacterales bacterium]
PDTPSLFWSDVSLSGNSIRAWPSVLLFSLLPTNGLRALVQVLLYGGAWSLVVLFIISRYSGAIRALVGSAVVVLSLTPLFFEWNITLLAESLTISFLVGATGLVLLSLITESSSRRFYLVMGATLLVCLAGINRLPAFIFFLPIFFLLIDGFRSDATGRRKWVIGGGVAVLLLLYPLWYNARTDDWWSRGHVWWASGFPERVAENADGEPEGLTRSAWNFVILSSENASGGANEFSDTLFDSVLEETGPCITRYRGRLLASTSGVAAKLLDTGVRTDVSTAKNPFDQIKRVAEECPGAAAWLNENFSSYYLGFLLSHPRLTTQHLLWTFRSITLSDGVNPVDTVLPVPVQQLVQGSQTENSLNTPLNAWLVVALLLMVAVLVLRIPNRSRVWTLAWLTAATALGSTAISNLMIAYDLDRITSPSVAVLFVSLAILIAESSQLLRERLARNRVSSPAQ